MKHCLTCLTPDTRPRVKFNSDGVCNACLWAEKKKTIDWEARRQKLEQLCDNVRRKDSFDVIVPCSGGKDGSYVAWKLKHEFGMHPLCLTFSPPLQTAIGRLNLDSFRNSGFDLIEIRPNPEIYRRLCRRMFIEQARCKFPFVIGIATSVMRESLFRNIPFVMWGEEGETEYSGDNSFADQDFMNDDYLIRCYHEGNNLKQYLDEFTVQELQWWLLPEWTSKFQTWWSKWESWDDQLHRNLAVEKCGLRTSPGEVGTFTNYAQLDDILQDLHAYEMFIKYGFGRATGDCNLAIHAGRMTREEAVEVAREKDGIFPIQYLRTYLEFFEMSEEGFWAVIESHANKEILVMDKREDRPWILRKPIR